MEKFRKVTELNGRVSYQPANSIDRLVAKHMANPELGTLAKRDIRTIESGDYYAKNELRNGQMTTSYSADKPTDDLESLKREAATAGPGSGPARVMNASTSAATIDPSMVPNSKGEVNTAELPDLSGLGGANQQMKITPNAEISKAADTTATTPPSAPAPPSAPTNPAKKAAPKKAAPQKADNPDVPNQKGGAKAAILKAQADAAQAKADEAEDEAEDAKKEADDAKDEAK